MTEAVKFALTYPSIIDAKHTFERVKPVLEEIFKYKESGERFTPSMIGEAIMGEKYHETKVTRGWNGKPTKVRIYEAISLSSTIGHALGKLRVRKMVTYTTEKDMDHPHIFEDYDDVYTLNGKVLPENVTVTLADGTEIEIPASYVKGAKMEYTKTMVTRYPKIDWYTFK